jgi:serine/threonine protein kinase
MELLSGKPLRKIMRDQQLDYQKIVHIGVQVAEALDYAHHLGIVHRDIKPSNIILTHDDHVKITDFGIAHVEDAKTPQQTRAGEILGTPIYMSPEQVMGQPVDGRSDLYSLGVILYELFTGKNPFRGENLAAIFNKIIQNAPSIPQKTDSPTAQALSTLIMKSISQKPADRFQTGKAMAEPLKACLQRRKSDDSRQPAQPVKPKHTRRYALIAVVLMCLIGAAVFAIKPWKTIEQNLPPAINAALSVSSKPSGAQLFLDGAFKGKTPLVVGLPLGKYEVRLSLPDFYEWESQLQLTEEGEMPLFVRLIPMNEEISDSEEKSK